MYFGKFNYQGFIEDYTKGLKEGNLIEYHINLNLSPNLNQRCARVFDTRGRGKGVFCPMIFDFLRLKERSI